MMDISLDFEKEELDLREEIWDHRIGLLLNELKSGKAPTFRVNSE
jgi:hypothetical protein